MTCNCLERIEARLMNHYRDNNEFEKEVIAVSIQKAFIGTNLRTYSTIFITVDGMKEQKESMLNHSFCPFCGRPEVKP